MRASIRPLGNLLPLLMLVLVWASPRLAEGRDCPNAAAGYPFLIGDSLELGAEFRAFYFGISVGGLDGERRPGDMPTAALDSDWGDGEPAPRHFENNVFLGLRPFLNWYATEHLTLAVENELRFRWPGWEERTVPGLDHRWVSLFLEYEGDGLTLTGGVQPFTFGTGAVLDQRFIGVRVEVDRPVYRMATFGGMTMRPLMRNAGNSMWMSSPDLVSKIMSPSSPNRLPVLLTTVLPISSFEFSSS